jgi:hypothetical protein
MTSFLPQLSIFLFSLFFPTSAFAIVARPCPEWYPTEQIASIILGLIAVILPLFAKYYFFKKLFVRLGPLPSLFRRAFVIANFYLYPLALSAVLSIGYLALSYRYAMRYGFFFPGLSAAVLALAIFTLMEKIVYNRSLQLNKYGSRGWAVFLLTALLGWSSGLLFYYIAFAAAAPSGFSSGGECADANMRRYSSIFVLCALFCTALASKYFKSNERRRMKRWIGFAAVACLIFVYSAFKITNNFDLQKTLIAGDSFTFRVMLILGANPNQYPSIFEDALSKDGGYRQPFHGIFAETLLANGIDVVKQNALLLAARSNRLDIVTKIVERERNFDLSRALKAAIRSNDRDYNFPVIKYLLQEEADLKKAEMSCKVAGWPCSKDDLFVETELGRRYGTENLLCLTIERGASYETTKLLLEKGLDPNRNIINGSKTLTAQECLAKNIYFKSEERGKFEKLLASFGAKPISAEQKILLASSPDAIARMKEARAKADQGIDEGQLELGSAYLWGHAAAGIVQNKKLGVQLIKKASLQGYSRAINALASAYQKGDGIAPNAVEAFFWFNLARTSPYDSDTFARERAKIARNLTPEQIASVRKRLREWKPAPTSNTIKNIKIRAERGNDEDQARLGWLHFKGAGVPLSYKEAYFWGCILSFTNMYAMSSENEDAKHLKAAAAQHLTPDEITIAVQRVAEWARNHPGR